MRAIVVGLGNAVRRDDGVGLAVARAVRMRLAGRDGVEVEELWAGGLRLAEALVGYDLAVVVDAMTTRNHPPGTVARLDLDEICGLRTIDCMHDMTLPDALNLLRLAGESLPTEIVVIGVEAGDTDTLDESLTAPVAAAVPAAVEAVLNALEGGK